MWCFSGLAEMSVERVNLGEKSVMVRCDGVSHTQEVFVLKMETGGKLGICGGSHINWRNAFEAFSSSLWMHFISGGQLLIGHILADGKTDVGNKMEVADEEEGGHQLLNYSDVSSPLRSFIQALHFSTC